MSESLPALEASRAPENAVLVQAAYKDPKTGETYVHRDLVKAQEAWAEEAHISPVNRIERFGAVDDLASYVKRYGEPATTFVSWNREGIGAVLDYPTKDTLGRMQWRAFYPFDDTAEWDVWHGFCDGAVSQRTAVEFLEDHAQHISDPNPAALMTLLRSLKAWSNANAEATYNEDGTAKVSFAQETGVRNTGRGELALPSEIKIAIPLIVGHPDTIALTVRVRVTVGDGARLAFRFSIPRAEEVLDQLRAELAAKAQAALGNDYTILRAAD